MRNLRGKTKSVCVHEWVGELKKEGERNDYLRYHDEVQEYRLPFFSDSQYRVSHFNYFIFFP